VLTLEGVSASYGAGLILSGVDLDIQEGELVCILGRNGVGKSTTLKCIMGLLACESGKIVFKGEDITKKRTERIARMGIGYVPDDRGIFNDLTVSENLRMAEIGSRRSNRARALEYFPEIEKYLDHKGGSLSGGQQQMLAIARAVTSGGDLLILDEPSEGLAPVIRDDLKKIMMELKKKSTILLVEQNLKLAMDLSEKIYIMVNGRIAYKGTPEEVKSSGAIESFLML
jgi:branched-chain amino acid transport system ATP-binding protein